MSAHERDAADLGRSPEQRGFTLWSDGFHDDRFSDISSVCVWNDCAPDEYIFMVPQLVPPAAAILASERAEAGMRV